MKRTSFVFILFVCFYCCITYSVFASKNILLISGHSDIKTSVVNKTIIENLKKEFSNLEVSSLCELYPNYQINVKAEQEKLIKADIVILQFPFYWYNAPSILRKYFEDVFTHDWAFGRKGNALKGKKIIISFTIGGKKEQYKKGGSQNFEIEDFMPPFKQMANMCKMKLVGFVYSTGYLFNKDKNEKTEHAKKHAKELTGKIKEVM